jgi:hypothetical protein
VRKIYTLILIFFPFLIQAQNYKPFHAGSIKLFAGDPVADSTYSIAFDSVVAVGGDSVYFNHTGLDGDIVSEDCQFWGGPVCTQQNKPLWLGCQVISDNAGHYLFLTNQGDTLHLDFTLLTGDSSVIYQDDVQTFYMVSEGTDTMTVLGLADSVKLFRMVHVNVDGHTVSSPSDDPMIITGKVMGLVEFFRVDLFPQLLQPLHLIGNLFPEAGLTKLTDAMLYDHQPGDEIQYFDYSSYPGGPPEDNYQRYIKHHFLERDDTPDSIIYTVVRNTFEAGSPDQETDTITLRYRKDDILAVIPFDHIDQSASLVVKKSYQADYCSLNLWSYSLTPGYLTYCLADNCWGSYDIPGPPPTEQTVYVCGLGLYRDESAIVSPPPYGYDRSYRIIYFKKNGVVCGDEVFVGMNDFSGPPCFFTVYPNPVHRAMIIDKGVEGESILSVCDMTGQEVMRISVSKRLTKIDIGALKKGIYLVRIISGTEVGIRKIIKD